MMLYVWSKLIASAIIGTHSLAELEETGREGRTEAEAA